MTDDDEKPGTSDGDRPDTRYDVRKWRLFAIVALVSLIADQATKIWARSALPVGPVMGSHTTDCTIPDSIVSGQCTGIPKNVIEGFWDWRLSMNPGSAFGLFSSANGARIFLSLVGIAAVVGMLFMLRRSRLDQKVLHYALALVAGGAIGNLVDRIYFGVVTDFVSWHYHDHAWPTFNVADVVLVVGVGLMFIDSQKENKREKAAKAERMKKAKEGGLVKDLRAE